MKVFRIVIGYSIYLMALLPLSAIQAQIDPIGAFNKHIAENWNAEYVRIGQYRVKGSPYLLGESFAGTVTYKGGKKFSNTQVLYDIYSQIAGIDVSNEIFEAALPLESFSIVLPEKYGGKNLLFNNTYVYGKADLKGYLNVLEDGKKLVLLKMFKSRLLPDKSNYVITDLKVFEQYYEYFLYHKANGNLVSIKLRKRDIARELSNEDFLKAFLATNPNDLSKEENVINLVRSFNLY